MMGHKYTRIAAFPLAVLVWSVLLNLPVHSENVPWHWPSGNRVVTVEDRTGDASWRAAEQQAVREWDSQGTGVDLTYTEDSSFSGYCRHYDSTVSVCRHHLRNHGWQAVTWPLVSGPHYIGAYVEVDDLRSFTPQQQLNLLCHELGHVLGLSESQDPNSCMADGAAYPTTPQQSDFQKLRQIYNHVDQ